MVNVVSELITFLQKRPDMRHCREKGFHLFQSEKMEIRPSRCIMADPLKHYSRPLYFCLTEGVSEEEVERGKM